MTLKSIAEHNAERWAQWQSTQEPIAMGVKCPDCGDELQRDRFTPITSVPPQVTVDCTNCGWRGNILA